MDKCPVCKNEDRDLFLEPDGLTGMEVCLSCGAMQVQQYIVDNSQKVKGWKEDKNG